MACPTCDHTMENISTGRDNDWYTFLCPRCGTVRMYEAGDEGNAEVYVPKLVGRCRTFEGQFWPTGPAPIWRRLGIAESINLPADRPQ